MSNWHQTALAGVTGVGMCLSGCSFGPTSVKTDRARYNFAIQESANEQMLLNLVRLKYREPLLFLEVGSIASHFNYGANAGTTANIPLPGTEKRFYNIFRNFNLGLSYAESPTVTYSPLQGEQFASRMLTEMDMTRFALLYHSGWGIDLLMRLAVERVGNLHNRPSLKTESPSEAQVYDRFIALARLLRQLQERGDLHLVLMPNPDTVLSEAVPPEEVRAASLISADQAGYRYRKGKDGKYELCKAGQNALVIELRYSTEAEADEVARVLGLKSVRKTIDGHSVERFRLVRFSDYKKDEAQDGDAARLPVRLRSYMDVLFYLAQGIEVPAAHLEQGYVKVHSADENTTGPRALTRDILDVRCRILAPSDEFVSVKYRGHWFYVANDDLRSKDTFSLLLSLLSLQASDTRAPQPMLTLPVGG